MSNNTCNEPIRLGLMPPLTGLVGIYGDEIVRAAMIACGEINERGGVLGRPLQLIVEDDGSLPETAVQAAIKLVDEHHCSAIIGNLLSNSRILVATQVAEPRRIPYLNFSFYEGSISGRYFFHFAALPNQQIDKMIACMAKYYGQKMFFAGNNYEWPRGSIDAAKRALTELGGAVVGEEYLSIGVSYREIDNLLKQVAHSGADIFVPFFAGIDQIKLLTRFSELGLKNRMAVVMGHFDEIMASRLPASVREGFYSSNTYFMSVDTPGNRNYLARLEQLPGIDGVWPYGNGMMTNFGEATYLCVQAFAKAAEVAGSVYPEALVAALESVSIKGPQGRVQMDANTHHAYVNTYLSRCTAEGSFRIIESFGIIPPVIPERYRMRARQSAEAAKIDSVSQLITDDAKQLMQKLSTAWDILSIADMAILATDEFGIIVEANTNACQVFGYSSKELIGLSVHLLLPPHLRERHVEMFRLFVEGEETERRMSGRSPVTGYRKDGTFFPLEASIAKFRQDGHWLLVVTMRDITENKRVEDEILWSATHDALTELPNRRLLRERLTDALQRSRRQGTNVALLFVDLDDFRFINDIHDHKVGDQVLKTASRRLMEIVRPGDSVAHLSADEFVVLCEQLENPTIISTLAERINEALRQPIEFNGNQVSVTASVGIAVGQGSTHSADDLLRSADTAMSEVKMLGKDSWYFFNDSLQEKVRLRLSITQGLRLAIERDELSPRFQPIVCAATGRIIAAELLLRWFPSTGEVSPAIFIPIAEMTGPILAIGNWVFREACRAEAEWRRRWGDTAPSYISVNVSARQLDEESLSDQFAEIIRETGADPSRILLEITETSLMADVETNLRMLRRLADQGLRVAVDDFGTGYSSLAQLIKLPVNVLKIDRAFIDGLENHQENRLVTQAIIGLGRGLGLKMVAEGVENELQLRELRALGCDYIQGYYFYRPLDWNTFVESVEREIETETPDAPSPLFFVLYVSQAVRPMQENEIEALLEQTRQFNKINGITGCLLHRDGWFMQLIEGSPEKVMALVEKIKLDPRHKDMQVVIQGPERRRLFPEWSMGYREVDQANDEPDFSSWRKRVIGFDELAEDAKICYEFITSFKTRTA